MPLNVRRLCTSILLVFISLVIVTRAQTVPSASPQATNPQPSAPTSGDVMRERISKAKAFIAVRNYNAAIYELENIRRETADSAVQGVVSVLLMNSYLEQGDFKRAQDLLANLYTAQKTTKPNAAQIYNAVAGQVVKGARSRADRYRSLGLTMTDRTLPLEAINDLEKMRETLEIVITQSKEIAKEPKKASDAMMLLEEASTSRSILARDDYDARRWKDGVADAREDLASSRSVVLSAVNDIPGDKPIGDQVAANNKPTGASTALPSASQPITEPKPSNEVRDREVKQPDAKPQNPRSDETARSDKPVFVPSANTVKETPKPADTQPKKVEVKKDDSPLDVGPLLGYATKQTSPVYPASARSIRVTGVVRVDLTVDENGDVADVQKMSGPALLQAAAKDAIRKWKFRPFVRDGQPVKATGFVSFNFAL